MTAPALMPAQVLDEAGRLNFAAAQQTADVAAISTARAQALRRKAHEALQTQWGADSYRVGKR